MARTRIFDQLQDHRFWLLDVSPSAAFPFFVMNPAFGFASATSPEITLEADPIQQFNSMWPRHAYTGASVAPISLTRGVQIIDSSFYQWVKSALNGTGRPNRNLVLIQYMGLEAGATGLGAVLSAPLSPIGIGHNPIPGKAWFLWDCIPTRYKGASDFDAKSGEVSIAELDLQPVSVEELGVI